MSSSSGSRSGTPPPYESRGVFSPGQVAAKEVGFAFDRSRFVSVFGEETVNEWTKNGDIDWEMLSNVTVSTYSPQKL